MKKHDQQLTLGQFIDRLKELKQDSSICFEFCCLTPTTLESYRGYYEDLALGFEEEGWGSPSVGELLAICEEAVGETMQGYKGGDYLMDRDTALWVANSGIAGSTAIVGILGDDDADCPMIQTKYIW